MALAGRFVLLALLLTWWWMMPFTAVAAAPTPSYRRRTRDTFPPRRDVEAVELSTAHDAVGVRAGRYLAFSTVEDVEGGGQRRCDLVHSGSDMQHSALIPLFLAK
uniref:Putative secreted protein n=1 Tax=Anopheles darlingi TaxID=43151 RepID=A0A2M4DLB5_ANODA